MGLNDVTMSDFTRIDIAGPAPFNKLVFCNLGSPPVLTADKGLKRGKFRATSKYKLSGFDQANPKPTFAHTTIGWIYGTGLGNTETNNNGKDAWLYALDAVVNGGFDDDGHFFVEIDAAAMMPPQTPNKENEPGGFMIFSYILVQEPQPTQWPTKPPHGPFHKKDHKDYEDL